MGAGASEEGFQIVDFRDCHAAGFRALNLAWIREHFPVEEEDERQLGDPRVSILEPGGEILIALIGSEVVGSCALLVHGPGEFELAKFAVSADHQRAGIGSALVKRAIDRARARGMRRVFLVSNSKLLDARRVFTRYGFVDVPLSESPYDNADVAMSLDLGTWEK